MTARMPMLRLVWGALRYRAGATVALAALAILAVAAGAAIPLYSAAAERATVDAVFRQAAPAQRSLVIDADVPVTGSARAALDGLLAEVRRHAPHPALTPVTGARADGIATGPAGDAVWVTAPLVARDGYCERLALSGRCAERAGEVVVSAPTAARLGLSGSDGTLVYRLPGVAEPVTLRVVGRYEPAPDAYADGYWAGRQGLTPLPLRVTNPIFTPLETFDGAGSLGATVDLVVTGPDWPRDGFAPDLARAAADNGYEMANGLPGLARELTRARQRLLVSAPLGAVTVLLLSCGVLLLAAGHLARGRRAEHALGLLRGTPAWHRLLATRGTTLLVLLLCAPVGAAAGWLGVWGLTRAGFGRPEPVPWTWHATVAAVAVLVLAMAGVLIVEGAKQSGPLLESLRGVPPRQRRGAAVFDLVVAVVAVAATAQAVVSGQSGAGGDVGMVAPVLLALAIGVLAARLVPPAARAAGAAWLHRGRLAPGLAAVQLARRPGAVQVVTLVVVCAGLAGHTADAWERASRQARDLAVAELGAPQVVTVSAPTRAALLAAVRSADPHGDWAMAAARARMSGGRTLLAVDTPRLAATMASVSGVDGPALASRLRPEVAAPLVVDGAELVIDLAVTEAVAPLAMTAVLVAADGTTVTATTTVAARPGRRGEVLAVPGCAVAPGCRLAWLSFDRSPDELRLHAVLQHRPNRTVVAAPGVAAAARWRSSFELEREVRVRPGGDHVALTYTPADPRFVSRDIRLHVADGPVPLPVAVAADASLPATRDTATAEVFTSADRPVEVVAALPGLAGVPGGGLLADLELADRLGDSADNSATLQVWLGPAAPGDALRKLEAAGLIVTRVDTVAGRVAAQRHSGAGLGLLPQAAAAALAVLLVLLAILVLAYTDRRQRLAELVALRDQGVPARVLRRAAHGGYLAVVLAATPVALLACGAVWSLAALTGPGGGPAVSAVAWPVLAALGVAAAAAWYADHRLARAAAGPGTTQEARQ